MDFNDYVMSNTGRDLEYHRKARTVGIEFAEKIYNAAVLAEREACAVIAYNGCLVPPDGGSPSEAEVMLCDAIAAAIRARNHDA